MGIEKNCAAKFYFSLSREVRKMANVIDSDYEFALSLHRELNALGYGVEVDFMGTAEALRPAPKYEDSVLVLSDSDTEVDTHKLRARSRSPLSGALGQVSCENQQAITVSVSSYGRIPEMVKFCLHS